MRLSLLRSHLGHRKPLSLPNQARLYALKASKKTKKSEEAILQDGLSTEDLLEKAKDIPAHEQIIDFFGLGKKDPSAEWKDKKLEARVAGLFKQTLDLAKVPGAALHPEDQKIQAELGPARQRLAIKLFELRYHNPEKFNQLYDFLFQASAHQKIEKEQQVMREGAFPGTLEKPWKDGNLLWQAFFESHTRSLAEAFTIEARRKQMIRVYISLPPGLKHLVDGKSYQEILDKSSASHPLKHKYPWLPDGAQKLEQLDEPLAWIDSRTKKKKCIFCSGNKDLYVLEPMNVPLLLRFMNMSGFIKPRKQTGLCKTMQARVARTIKHARCLGLFHYKGGAFTVHNPLNMVLTRNVEEEEVESFNAFDSVPESGKQALLGNE